MLAVSVAMPAIAQDRAQAEQTWRTLAPQADTRAGDPASRAAMPRA